jgi:LysM repeat protein
MAAQQAAQPPVGDPVNTPEAAPVPVDQAPPASNRRFKSWIIARNGNVGVSGGSHGSYRVKQGDTIEQLAKRFYTTPAEIRKLNPGIGSSVEPGDKLKLKRKVVPTAKAWKD